MSIVEDERNKSGEDFDNTELSADELLRKLKKELEVQNQKHDTDEVEAPEIKARKESRVQPEPAEGIQPERVDDPLAGFDLNELINKYIPESDRRFIQPIEEDGAEKEPVVQEEEPEEAEIPESANDETPWKTEEIDLPGLTDEISPEIKEEAKEIKKERPVDAETDHQQLRYKIVKREKKAKKGGSAPAKPAVEKPSVIKKEEKAEEAIAPADKKKQEKQTKKDKKQKKDSKDKLSAQNIGTEKYEDDDEIDATDVKLMMAFGMEEELEQTVGFDKITEVEKEIDETDYEETPEPKNKKAEEKIVEYTSASQTEEFVRAYKGKYSGILIRLVICAVLFIVTFLYENIKLFGGALPAALNPEIFTFIHIMVNLQLLVISAALIGKQLISGIKGLFSLKPTPDSITAVLMLFSLIYMGAALFIGSGTLKMYTFPVVFCVFMTLLGNFYSMRREIYSFNIIASKRPKYMMTEVGEEEAKQETEMLGEYLPQNPHIFRIERAAFVDGFVARTKSPVKGKMPVSVIIPLVLVISVVFFAIELIGGGTLFSAVTMGYISLLVCTPLTVFLTYSYPFYKASKEAYGVESAIIDENSLEEYSAANAVSFEDREVFPSYGVKVKSIKIYGNNRIDHIIYNAASLFMKLGGPLADVFEIATRDLGHSDDVHIVDVAANGIEAAIEGSHIYIGKAPYIKANGFHLPRESSEAEDAGEVSVMYMVLNGQLAAKMNVEYIIDPDFEPLLAQLRKSGVCVGIKTFDPNIDDQMLSTRIKISKYPVKVIKLRSVDSYNELKPSVNSGIVSKNSAKALLQTMSLCGSVINAVKSSVILKMFSVFVSLILSAVVLMLGLLPSLMSLYIVLYQIFWLVPAFLIIGVCIRKL